MTPELECIRDLFADYQRPWFFAGGWAIDLWLGRKTREHADIDIAVLRADQKRLREVFTGWKFRFMQTGQYVDWREGLHLELPIHEIRAHSLDRAVTLEFLLNESTTGRWVYRRNSAVTRAFEEIGSETSGGLPFLNPAMVLLYKSKYPSEKDREDFNAAIERMDGKDRSWLRKALQQCFTAHPWIERL